MITYEDIVKSKEQNLITYVVPIGYFNYMYRLHGRSIHGRIINSKLIPDRFRLGGLLYITEQELYSDK